jgi:hypothetical protein
MRFGGLLILLALLVWPNSGDAEAAEQTFDLTMRFLDARVGI